LVFNDFVTLEEQRKVCKEYEITMDEDLEDKFQEWKKNEEELAEKIANSVIGAMGTVLTEEELTNLEEGQ